MLNSALPVRSRNTIRRVSNNASLFKTHRHKAVRHLLKVSLKPEPIRDRLNNSLPVDSPARSLNIPIISLLISSPVYPDHRLPTDLVYGMDIVGSIPASNARARRDVMPSTNLYCIERGLKIWNRSIIRDLAKAKGELPARKRWESSPIDRQKGWMSMPTPATPFDRSHTVLSPRFCISEQHGAQATKFRVIGDLSRSLANAAVGAVDTYFPQDLDTFMVLARLRHTYGASNLRMWSVDFPNAYKTIGLIDSSWGRLIFSSSSMLKT